MKPKDLKKWREENDYSQSELGQALGVATMTVSRWETGTRAIPSFLALALESVARRGRGNMKQSIHRAKRLKGRR